MAERNGLLNRRTGYTVPRVRIPVSPQIFFGDYRIAFLAKGQKLNLYKNEILHFMVLIFKKLRS